MHSPKYSIQLRFLSILVSYKEARAIDTNSFAMVCFVSNQSFKVLTAIIRRLYRLDIYVSIDQKQRVDCQNTSSQPLSDNHRQHVCKQAQQWLRTSDIMQPDGAVFAWQAPEQPARQFLSSEITGYAISFFCWAGDVSAALRAARWLVSTAQDEFGAMRCRWYSASTNDTDFQQDGPLRWIFDTGIALKGLVDIYRLTRLSEFVAPITAAVLFLLQTRGADGLFPGRWNVETQTPAQDLTRWSAQSGSYHAKVERGIVAAALALHEESWLEGLEQRVNTYINKYQLDSGCFVSYPTLGGVHLHPHFYTCESLWDLGTTLQMPRWLEAARRGIQWAVNASMESGCCPRTYFRQMFNPHGRIDIAAQYLRALLLLGYSGDPVWAACQHVLTFINEAGAGEFGWNADGTCNHHPDAWGTMAAIQALQWSTHGAVFLPSELL